MGRKGGRAVFLPAQTKTHLNLLFSQTHTDGILFVVFVHSTSHPLRDVLTLPRYKQKGGGGGDNDRGVTNNNNRRGP